MNRRDMLKLGAAFPLVMIPRGATAIERFAVLAENVIDTALNKRLKTWTSEILASSRGSMEALGGSVDSWALTQHNVGRQFCSLESLPESIFEKDNPNDEPRGSSIGSAVVIVRAIALNPFGQAIREHRQCGTPKCPAGVDAVILSDNTKGISVRAVAAYDWCVDRMIVRFDMVTR